MNPKITIKGIDLSPKIGYNRIRMKTEVLEVMKIDNHIVQEADNLSKETGIPFRDALEVIYNAYLTQRGLVEVRGSTKRKEPRCRKYQ